MKKICSITTIPGSMQSFMIPEALALSKAGWDSIVISSFKDKDIEKIPSRLRYYRVPMERTYNIKVAINCIWKLYKIFRQEKFDVVQYGTTHAALYGSIASYIARTPNRVFLQWGPTGYNDFTGVKRWFTKSIEILIGKLSTTIRTVSRKNLIESVKDGLYPENKASVVGAGGTIGVDLNDYPIEKREEFKNEIRKNYGLKNSDFIIGFIGRVSKAKGIYELLEAFKIIRDKYPVKLMLIGPNETTSAIPLLTWAKESEDVIFTGRIPHEEISKYFACLNVLAHPTYREGFGMVLQEAMAIGTPIITTDIPGPSEVIEDGVSGILVPIKNSEKLAEAIERIILNPQIISEFEKHGRERVEKFFERKLRLKLLVEDKEKLISINK